MADRARGGKSKRAGVDSLPSDGTHLGDILGRRRLVADGPVAHDEDPHGGVRQQGADIDIARPGLQSVKIFGEAFLAPIQPLVHDCAGDILNTFHQLDQFDAVLGAAGREADATIAHHHAGHPVPCRGREVFVPNRLTVVMGMNVDEAGCDDAAAGVDLFGAATVNLADCAYFAIVDGDVAVDWGAAGAVDEGAVAHHQIM